MVITKTPLRISLVGGGTDQESFFQQHPGCVVSFAIDKHIYISVNNKFDGRFRISYSKTENVDRIEEIEHSIVREALQAFAIRRGLEITSISDIPGNGTGLGSSSAFAVGLTKAFGRNVSPERLAERAYRIERASGNNNGKQDGLASAVGGFNKFTFHATGAEVHNILPGQQWIDEFENHSLLLWTGLARDANEILKAQEDKFENGSSVQQGIELARLANDFYIELMGGADMKRIGEFLHEGWGIKQTLARGIGTPEIANLYGMGIFHGAYGGKVCGAGGGGFIFFIAPPDAHLRIREATGLRKVPFKIEQKGSEVIYDG